MVVNFEIEDNYAIQYQNRHIDLHNNFELFEIRDFQNQIEIEFRKSIGEWVPKDELDRIIFLFNNVSYKYEKKGDSVSTPDDRRILSELTFFPDDMRDENDSLTQRRTPYEGDDMILFFENGRLIRISCSEVELVIE